MKSGLTVFLTIIVMIFLCGLCALIYIVSINAFTQINSRGINGVMTGEAVSFSQTCQNTSVADNYAIQLKDVELKDGNNNTIPSSYYEVVGGCIRAK